MKSQAQMIALLMAASYQHYQKSGVYNYEVAKQDGTCTTKHGDKVEVANTPYSAGDYLLTDTLGGVFPVEPNTFRKRYEILNEESDTLRGTAKAKGQCWAIQWTDAPTEFTSPWNANEGMIIETGDYLASPNPEFTEAYRIKKEEFEKSYALVQNQTA